MITGDVNSTTFLIKTDSAGNLEWQNTYLGSGGVSVDICNDGGYIIGGGLSGSNDQSLVVKTDSAGNMQWNRIFGGPFDENNVMVRITSDGGYILAGDTAWGEDFPYAVVQLHLMKLDSSGNTKWSRGYGRVNVAVASTMIHELNDGSFVVTGQTLHPKAVESINGILLKVNSQGDSLWYREYNYCDYSIDYFRDVQPTKDGGFIAVGFKNSQCITSQDMWVVKTNCLGFDAPPQPYFTHSVTDTGSFIVTHQHHQKSR